MWTWPQIWWLFHCRSNIFPLGATFLSSYFFINMCKYVYVAQMTVRKKHCEFHLKGPGLMRWCVFLYYLLCLLHTTQLSWFLGTKKEKGLVPCCKPLLFLPSAGINQHFWYKQIGSNKARACPISDCVIRLGSQSVIASIMITRYQLGYR